jgi:hypothetical protein
MRWESSNTWPGDLHQKVELTFLLTTDPKSRLWYSRGHHSVIGVIWQRFAYVEPVKKKEMFGARKRWTAHKMQKIDAPTKQQLTHQYHDGLLAPEIASVPGPGRIDFCDDGVSFH